MLPGFRFLFAAILLSTSILVFGLGAAALLRTTHEQYVSNPSWRNGPQEQVFAPPPEPAQPVLAVLRAEPEPAEPVAAQPEPSVRDQIPTIGLPASEPEQVAAVTTEADVQVPVAATPADAAAAEPAKAETTAEAAAPVPTDTLTASDTTPSMPEAKLAATVSEPAPADLKTELASPAPDVAPAKVAALDDPATTAAKDPPAKAKEDGKKADSKVAKHRAKPKKRHRVMRRPPPQPVQQSFDPFGQQQQPALAATTARARQ